MSASTVPTSSSYAVVSVISPQRTSSSPSPNATFKEFVGTIDGRGGYAFVETDDPNTVLRDASIFGAWFDFTVHPVVDIAETARIAAEAIEFRDSVS